MSELSNYSTPRDTDQGEARSNRTGNSTNEKQYIKPPQGFSAPEGFEGKEFDLVCTFEAESDGRLCLKKLGDHDMSKNDPEHRQEEKEPDYKAMSQSIMGDIGASGGNSGY